MNRRFMSASMLMDFTASKLASMVAGVLMVGAVLDAAVAHSALTVPIWPPLNTTVPNLRALALSGELPRRIRSTRAVGTSYTALAEWSKPTLGIRQESYRLAAPGSPPSGFRVTFRGESSETRSSHQDRGCSGDRSGAARHF
jgi:hypothetical protein